MPDVPPEAVFKGYEDFVVQDLVLQPRVVRYRRERWLTPDGQSLAAPLPADVLSGSHFGPDLICFVLHQYHHQHVTQPLLLEQLHPVGIDISAGELSRILSEGKDSFHQEKAELLPAALAVSTYAQVDDTGARHQGHNGSCTHVGNSLGRFVIPPGQDLGDIPVDRQFLAGIVDMVANSIVGPVALAGHPGRF